MTKSYAQIVKQIESLKQEAEKVRRKEIEGVVGRIREAISVYGLTADDLGFGAAKAKRGRPAGFPAKKRGRKATKAAAPSGPLVVPCGIEAQNHWSSSSPVGMWAGCI
jgi:DNA-binding protein H-NS